MAVKLTSEQLAQLKDLEENFEDHVAAYRSQKQIELRDGSEF